MISEIKRLWRSRHTAQGSIRLTIFFVNLFLILCHIFLMVVYVMVNHKFMIYINFLSLVLYISAMFLCYKKTDSYVMISFIEIWIHMLCAIISFGWTPCFQNWSFALIASYFLPAFNSENQKNNRKRPVIFAIVVIITYFVLSVLINVVDFRVMYPLSNIMNRILFTANNLFSFVTIMMFAIFYTSRSKRKVHELTRKADYDELTKLYNRYALNQIGADVFIDKKSYSVAIMDIDFFKKVNDTYGHISGDMVLKQMSSLLKSYMGKGLIPGRWGGEEFVLIAPSEISYETFLELLEKLRSKVEKSKFIIENKKKINLTISVGAYHGRKRLENLISDADENLYQAKETGRNKVIG